MKRILGQVANKLKVYMQKLPHKRLIIPAVIFIIAPAFLLCAVYGGLSWFFIGFGALRLVWQRLYSKPLLHKTVCEKQLTFLGGFSKTLLLAAFLSGSFADIPLGLLAGIQVIASAILFAHAADTPDTAGFVKGCLINTLALATSIAMGAVVGICLISVSLCMAALVLLIKRRYLLADLQMQFSMA